MILGALNTRPRHARPNSGYAVPFALYACFILVIGGAFLIFGLAEALTGSTRQQRSKEALALAEAGLEKTLAALNTSHPYLLTQNHDPSQGECWEATGSCTATTAAFPSAMCQGWTPTQQQGIPLTGTVSNGTSQTGEWRVVRYTFSGSTVFGGTGSLRIEGLRRASSDGPVLARAQVEQSVSVQLKDCSPSGLNSIGLLSIGPQMNVQKSQIEEILGLDPAGNPLKDPAPVHCINCQQIVSQGSCPSDALCHDSQAKGIWSIGLRPFPLVPAPPPGLTAQLNLPNPLEVGQSNGGRCIVDLNAITHCRASSITINGNNTLKVVYPDPSNPATLHRQLRLYLDGNLTISGGGSICQAIKNPANADPPCIEKPWLSGLSPSSLQIYGPRECSNNQSVTLSGGAQALSLFALLPCADVTINGGSRTPDIYGAIWSRTYSPSGSSNLDIWVPSDLNSSLQAALGKDFSVAILRPVARGINRWVSYESTR